MATNALPGTVMNRRNFFASLFAGAGALALDPERLLWRPGAKLISIPRPTVTTLTTYTGPPLTISVGDQRLTIGDTVMFRKPMKFVPRDIFLDFSSPIVDYEYVVITNIDELYDTANRLAEDHAQRT